MVGTYFDEGIDSSSLTKWRMYKGDGFISSVRSPTLKLRVIE